MQVLNSNELQQVSGAGFFSNIISKQAKSVGSYLGTPVYNATNLFAPYVDKFDPQSVLGASLKNSYAAFVITFKTLTDASKTPA